MHVGKVPEDIFKLPRDKPWEELTHVERAELQNLSCFALVAIYSREKEKPPLMGLADACLLIKRIQHHGGNIKSEIMELVDTVFKETVIDIAKEFKNIAQSLHLPRKIENSRLSDAFKIFNVVIFNTKLLTWEELEEKFDVFFDRDIMPANIKKADWIDGKEKGILYDDMLNMIG